MRAARRAPAPRARARLGTAGTNGRTGRPPSTERCTRGNRCPSSHPRCGATAAPPHHGGSGWSRRAPPQRRPSRRCSARAGATPPGTRGTWRAPSAGVAWCRGRRGVSAAAHPPRRGAARRRHTHRGRAAAAPPPGAAPHSRAPARAPATHRTSAAAPAAAAQQARR
eukprot:scaffold18323_cov59-Phaeocystis_antarctica.AAC.1